MLNGTAERPLSGQAAIAERLLADPMVKSFDSLAVSPAQRLDYWQNQVMISDGLKLVCKTSNFVAKLQSRDLGLFKIYGLTTSTPHRAIRSDARDDICFVNIQRENDGAMFRGAHEINMVSGSMSIYEALSGYELDFPGNSRSVVLALPKSYLKNEVPNFNRHLDEVLPYDADLISMLATMCDNILVNSHPLRQPVIDGISASVRHLLLAILNDANRHSAEGPTIGQAAIINRIKNHVRQNIDDPELCPAKVADRTGITVSYLHKVFRAERTTLMQFVLSERLERCRADIAKCDRSANVSQIAFSWGFNDASHFTRSFRKKFGMSPREYRQAVEEQGRRFRVVHN